MLSTAILEKTFFTLLSKRRIFCQIYLPSECSSLFFAHYSSMSTLWRSKIVKELVWSLCCSTARLVNEKHGTHTSSKVGSKRDKLTVGLGSFMLRTELKQHAAQSNFLPHTWKNWFPYHFGRCSRIYEILFSSFVKQVLTDEL